MAKDDYDIILCKVLIYFYAILKRKIVFDAQEFDKTVKKGIDDNYFTDVLRLAQSEGLITGVKTTKVWGGSYIMFSDIEDIEITPAGIRHLKENTAAQRALRWLKETADIISPLAALVGLVFPK